MFDLNAVKEHLRVTHSMEDALLTLYLNAAKDYAESFLGRKLDDFGELPPTVLSGLLVHTALLYESREGEFIEKNLRAVRLLYWPHRKLSL